MQPLQYHYVQYFGVQGGGIWEGVYMTLAVAAYHWFLLHWSEH